MRKRFSVGSRQQRHPMHSIHPIHPIQQRQCRFFGACLSVVMLGVCLLFPVAWVTAAELPPASTTVKEPQQPLAAATSTAGKAADTATDLGATTDATTESATDDVISANVDWVQELERGGNTAIALLVLFLAMIGFAVERVVRLRRSAIIPRQLVPAVKDLWQQGKFAEIEAACAQRPSVLAKMIMYVVTYRDADPELLIPGVGDIAVRHLKAQNQRAYFLAVVAGLAPLLGLLGTMIGMIESFKLVELYGDEGGASMLAGSISKALITTAVGLIIAIPSLVLYHFFKFRCNELGHALDEEMEVLINAWLLQKPAIATSALNPTLSDRVKSVAPNSSDSAISVPEEKPQQA